MSQLESVLNSEEKKLHDVSFKLWARNIGCICGVEKFVIAQYCMLLCAPAVMC